MPDLWDRVAASHETDRVVKALEALTVEVKAQREATERVEALLDGWRRREEPMPRGDASPPASGENDL